MANFSETRHVDFWSEPRCLIESRDGDQLDINQETLFELKKITSPVVVASIVGLYRTGKSYLMNRLGGKTRGFELGSAVQSKTKGIWIWCMPHPRKWNCYLVLLDTEGLGDVEKGNINHDIWIFALTVLLSSTLIYNSVGIIAQPALNDLHLVTEIAEHIKVKSKSTQDDETTNFDKFFPNFVWAVRDFTLQLEVDGVRVTEDGYLDHALQLKHGIGKKISDYNLPRECIRTYFPHRKCFVFPSPVQDRSHLKDLESIKDEDLDPEFVRQSQKFLDHVFDTSNVKRVFDRDITGRLLAGLTECYVDAIHNGVVPCIETAVETTSKLENERAIHESMTHYREQFRRTVQFPTETMVELSNTHHQCEHEASQVFLSLAIFDFDKVYYAKLAEELQKSYEEFCNENERASHQYCCDLLNSLHQPVEENFRKGRYACPGGYEEYKNNMDMLEERYKDDRRKGVMSEEVLTNFMKGQEATAMSILKADEKLVDEAKKLEEEKQRANLMEREKIAAEEAQKKSEQMMADQRRSYEEHMKRVQEKMLEEQQKIQKENEQILKKRLDEQEKLMKDGFDKRARNMEMEITDLKKEITANKSSKDSDSGSWIKPVSQLLQAVLPFFQKVMDYKMAKPMTAKPKNELPKTENPKTEKPSTNKNER